MAKWNLPWEGGCRCGRLRIRVTAPPMIASACHCHGCQRMSASAFSLTLTVPSDGFEVTQGEPVIGGLHGANVRHHHCGHCKSWVYTTVPAMDFFVNLRATMLDEHGWFRPYLEVWTDHALPWALAGAPKSYATEPDLPEYQELMTGFAAEGARPA